MMELADAQFFIWVAIASAVISLIFVYIFRQQPQANPFPEHKECDTCGQLGSDVQEGLCQICQKTYAKK